MSTHDVPGAVAEHHDVLRQGCWAEHDDGSLIYVYDTEGGRVVYSVFDLAQDPPVEYRDAMTEELFKRVFSWTEDGDEPLDDLLWTWHDKTSMPWERVMREYPAGTRHVSALDQLTAAQRVRDSLHLKASAVPPHRPARGVLERLRAALEEVRRK